MRDGEAQAIEASRTRRETALRIDPAESFLLLPTGIDRGPTMWRELWAYRELVLFLAWRDILLRYRQALLGVTWAVLQPVLMVATFTLFFGSLAGLESRTGGIPYSAYALASLLPWNLLAGAVTNASSSVVNSAHLVTKVYFPRLVIPLAALGAPVLDLASASVLLFGLLAYYGFHPSWTLLLMPVSLAGLLMLGAGLGAILSALSVRFRDFRYVVPFALQLWMFASGVAYPPAIVPDRWRPVFYLNPAAALVDSFRSAALGQPVAVGRLGGAVAVSGLILLLGARYFRSTERKMADII